ncbi:MAG: tetratricopeptide repeat protein [Gammaproteobacteria bacterium]|nr:tetratricopeptide repeat protein [Gammaproteobacteria bacterium]
MSGTFFRTTARYNDHSKNEKWFLTPFFLILCLLVWSPLDADDSVAAPPADWNTRGLQAIPLPKTDNLDEDTRARLEEARARVNTALQPQGSDRDLAAAYGELGALYQVHALHVAAGQCYENAIALDPDNFRWAYYSAYQAATTGRMPLAVQRYQKARILEPAYKALVVRLADALLDLNELDKARAAYEEVVNETGLEAAARYGLGQIALLQRDYETAIASFNRSLEADPGATRVHYSLAQALRAVKRNTEARTHLALRGDVLPEIRDPYIESLMAMKSGAHVHYIQAVKAINRNDHNAAREHFANGLAEDPDNAIALISYARTLYLTGEVTEALTTLERAITLQPDNALGLFLLGILAEEGGDTDRALDYYQRVLEYEPAHAGAHYYLGNHYFRQQNPQQATTHYQQALAADARYSAAYIPYLGALLGAGVSDSTLMQTLKDAVDYFPEQPIFRSLLVRLLATSSDPQLNDPREALRLAEQLAKEKRIPPHLEVLALANAANGRFKQAAAILEEVLIQIVWSMPGEAARLGEVQVAYQAGKLPPTEERQGWPVIPPPVFDAQGPFHNYPVTKPY